MNQHRSGDRSWCNFHPREVVVGICALCLNERLLVLASKQRHPNQPHEVFTRKSPISLAKIFALSSLLNRLDIKRHKADRCSHTSSTSPEDSFISIKFEDNGVASWDKGKITKKPHDLQCDMSWNDSWDKAKQIKSVDEHSKPSATLRWQRQIGRVFQDIRWWRSLPRQYASCGHKGRKSKV